MSFNVRVWTRDRDKSSPDYWKGRLDSIVRCVRDKDPDIICLQECLPRMAKAIKELGYKSAGVSFHHLMLVRKTMRCRRHRWRVFMDWCDVDGLRLINVHSRWEGRVVNDVVDDLGGVLDEFDRVIGLERLKALHLNDSKNARGSHKDRHEKLGQGCLGIDAFGAVVNEPRLKGLPMIMETPNELDGYRHEIAVLRALAGEDVSTQ